MNAFELNGMLLSEQSRVCIVKLMEQLCIDNNVMLVRKPEPAAKVEEPSTQTESKPNETKPSETKPHETKTEPIVTKPSETKPSKNKTKAKPTEQKDPAKTELATVVSTEPDLAQSDKDTKTKRSRPKPGDGRVTKAKEATKPKTKSKPALTMTDFVKTAASGTPKRLGNKPLAAKPDKEVHDAVMDCDAPETGAVDAGDEGRNNVVDVARNGPPVDAQPGDAVENMVVEDAEEQIQGERENLVEAKAETSHDQLAQHEGLKPASRDEAGVDSIHETHFTEPTKTKRPAPSSEVAESNAETEPPKRARVVTEPAASPRSAKRNIDAEKISSKTLTTINESLKAAGLDQMYVAEIGQQLLQVDKLVDNRANFRLSARTCHAGCVPANEMHGFLSGACDKLLSSGSADVKPAYKDFMVEYGKAVVAVYNRTYLETIRVGVDRIKTRRDANHVRTKYFDKTYFDDIRAVFDMETKANTVEKDKILDELRWELLKPRDDKNSKSVYHDLSVDVAAIILLQLLGTSPDRLRDRDAMAMYTCGFTCDRKQLNMLGTLVKSQAEPIPLTFDMFYAIAAQSNGLSDSLLLAVWNLSTLVEEPLGKLSFDHEEEEDLAPWRSDPTKRGDPRRAQHYYDEMLCRVNSDWLETNAICPQILLSRHLNPPVAITKERLEQFSPSKLKRYVVNRNFDGIENLYTMYRTKFTTAVNEPAVKVTAFLENQKTLIRAKYAGGVGIFADAKRISVALSAQNI